MRTTIIITAAAFGLMAFTFWQGFISGKDKAENQCKTQLLELADQQQQINKDNVKKILVSRKIAEVNNSLDRNQLIDKL